MIKFSRLEQRFFFILIIIWMFVMLFEWHILHSIRPTQVLHSNLFLQHSSRNKTPVKTHPFSKWRSNMFDLTKQNQISTQRSEPNDSLEGADFDDTQADALIFSEMWLSISDFEYQMTSESMPINWPTRCLKIFLEALSMHTLKSKHRDLTRFFLNTAIQHLGSWNRTYFSSLAVVITTVKRNGAAYLPSTLQRLGDQMSNIKGNRTVVLVVDHSIDGPSDITERMEEEFSRRYPGLFYFEYNDESSNQAMKIFQVVSIQRQALCIVNTLSRIYGRSNDVLIMEDDFLLCSGTLKLIHCILQRVTSTHENWISMRISYGMNGILIRNKDIPKIITFLILNMWHKPSDHNIVEWFLGQTGDGRTTGTNPQQRRPYFVYRFNLMSHIGTVSSFGHLTQTKPICFETMDGRIGLRHIEAFDIKGGCSRSELSPCWGGETEANSSYRIAESC
jgi:hypothetical protein